MLGFSSGMLASMGEGSPSTLEGEAEDTRERPTAELALGLGDALRSLQQADVWSGTAGQKKNKTKAGMKSIAEAARLVGRGMQAGGKTGGAYFTSCDPRSAFFQLPLAPDVATALLDRMRERSRIRTGFGSLH